MFWNIVKIYFYNIDNRSSFVLNRYFFSFYLLMMLLFFNYEIIKIKFIKFIRANYLNIIYFFIFKKYFISF